MARISAAKLHLLTVLEVQGAPDGDKTDGGGLLLRIRSERVSKASGKLLPRTESWVFRFTAAGGQRREMGLGPVWRGSRAQAGSSLTTARRLAFEARDLLHRGIDPIDQRDGVRDTARQVEATKRANQARERQTLARAAREYHARVIEPTRTTKHAAQWIASLENHMPAALWHAPVDSIDPPTLLAALAEVRPHKDARNLTGDKVPETMTRIRQRLDAVFEDAIFHKRCTSNPAAAIRRKMREGQDRRQRGELKALPYREAPAFMLQLRQAEGTAARCLELAVLTAARTSEVLLATWSEFDLDAAIWVCPAEPMKAKEAHTVHLSPRAVEVLRAQQGQHPVVVFPTPRATGKPMSNMSMLTVLDRMGMRERTTVHGVCRATFSTWANETGTGRPDVIEACLAHEESNRIRASYNRAAFTQERAALLAAWADFLGKPVVSNVLPLRAA